MKQQWQHYVKLFSGLNQRERVLIGVSAWFAIVLLGYTFGIEPALKITTKADNQNTQLVRENKQLEQQIELLLAQLQQDPNQQLTQQSQQLQQQIESIEGALQQELVDLVVPEQMAASLALLLAKAEGVDLIKLEILSSEAMTEQGGLYRHGVLLELEGSYFALQSALARMEQMERRFYWRQFSYKVTDFPLARLQLHLDTLGTEQEPIRVGYHQGDDANAGVASSR
ncbi:type II secretion system protein GspM [Ferrimonas lipolytica]|uniref:MSHA biogenesis protein MshJ n=1 Tax=Ferrimonas lipolytica TaxID=2724191 RepID=A0A6H1UFU9_9GAMM|nr:type II secretion system protein GspM [Ferrimonas lipolytica]QIZ77924.1 hypothetical protein HER31_14090 [Ferrimonas lipolytica]